MPAAQIRFPLFATILKDFFNITEFLWQKEKVRFLERFIPNRPEGVFWRHAAFDCFSFLYEWRKWSFLLWVFKLNIFVPPKRLIFQHIFKLFKKWHFEHIWSSLILNQNWTNLIQNLNFEPGCWFLACIPLLSLLFTLKNQKDKFMSLYETQNKP